MINCNLHIHLAINKVHKMASIGKKARNNLTVGLQSNYDKEADLKSVSPVMNTSMNEQYELKDFSGNDRLQTGGDQLQTVVDTELTEETKAPETKTTSVRPVSEASDIKTTTDFNDSGDTVNERRTISVTSNKSVSFENVKGNSGKTKPLDLEITEFELTEEPRESRTSIGSVLSTEMSVSVFGSSGSGRSSTPSHTSFQNDEIDELADLGYEMDDITLDYFCVDHMQLCSMKAISDNHGDCKNVVTAVEWAEEQQYERERKSTESQLQKFDTFAGIMIDERKDLKRYLTERKEDVTEEALELMEDLVTHLLKKQKEFTEKFEALHASKMKTITDQIKRCSMIQKETSTCMKQLAEFPSGSPEYQQARKKVHDKCPVYEEILRRDFHAATRMDYEFIPNSKAEDILANVRFVGDVRVRPKPCKLPGFLSQSRETDFTKRTITNIATSSGTSSDDSNNCCFSGCTYVSQDRIILADWNNNCLKMFNKNHIIVSRLDFDSNPWDVKTVDDRNVVVTVPGEEKVYIVSYLDQSLAVVSSFPTEAECWGIAPIGDKFVVTCDPWGKAPCLKVFTKTGKVSAFFQKDAQGELLFRCTQHIASDSLSNTLYVSSARQHVLLAITLSGGVVFRYQHEKLDFPTGVAIDNQGNLYVCGKDSHNVHQVSKSGEFLRILLTQKDNVNSPRGICFQPDGDKILVTDTAMPECQEFITAVLN